MQAVSRGIVLLRVRELDSGVRKKIDIVGFRRRQRFAAVGLGTETHGEKLSRTRSRGG